MLQKRQRLTVAQFDHHYKTGRRIHTPFFQLVVSPADRFHGAVVVGKKVCKRAVDRNRMRRQLYAVLYACAQKYALTNVYIVLVKPNITHASKTEVHRALHEVLGRHDQSR